MAKDIGCEIKYVTYKWPEWLRGQQEKQRIIWGYKILFLDVLFLCSSDISKVKEEDLFGDIDDSYFDGLNLLEERLLVFNKE